MNQMWKFEVEKRKCIYFIYSSLSGDLNCAQICQDTRVCYQQLVSLI